MKSTLRVLAYGLDTLVLNIHAADILLRPTKGTVAKELQEELDLLKEQSQQTEELIPTRFVFDGVPLCMTQKGGSGFQWILTSSKLALAVNRGKKMAMLAQVRCSSEYLWSVHDPGRVLSEVMTFLLPIFGNDLYPAVSSCDMALDMAGFVLPTLQEIKENFITRAQLDAQHPLTSLPDGGMIDGPEEIRRRWRQVTGLPFGSRSGAVSAILYDKTHEIKYQSPKKQWFHDIWLQAKDKQGRPLWDGESSVWRLEVRYKRPALHDGDVENAFDLEERLPGMWSYAVGHLGGDVDGLPDGWLRYVVPTDDTNRSRWPVHPDWEVVQTAFQPVPLEETDYQREQKEQEEYLHLADAELEARPFAVDPQKSPFKRRRPSAAAPAGQHASSPGQAPAVPSSLPPDSFDVKPFIRQRKRKVEVERMVAQITGCAITLQAWLPTAPGVEPDISETFHHIFQQSEEYLEKTGRDFIQSVRKKRDVYSIENND